LVAPASTLFVHVSAGELETRQLDGKASAVVDNTNNAPAGTDARECTVAAVPALVSKLCIVTVDDGGVVEVVVKLQLKLLANALPARSFTPDAPPVIVAV
jgi:hypothetical protein